MLLWACRVGWAGAGLLWLPPRLMSYLHLSTAVGRPPKTLTPPLPPPSNDPMPEPR